MLNSFTQYRSRGPGFGAIGYIFSSVVGQRNGPSGANAPPVHGIKNALGTCAWNGLFCCAEFLSFQTTNFSVFTVYMKLALRTYELK